MKKLIVSVIFVFSFLTGAFSQSWVKSSDLNFGFAYGAGKAIFNETQNNIKLKDVTANACGFYLEAMSEYTKYFGSYLDAAFLFPYKSEINFKANGYSFSISDSDLFKIKFVFPLTIGFNGIIPVSEKFKVALGAGFDMAWIFSESNSSSSASTSYSSDETDFVLGLNLKGVCTYLFNKHVGLNVGLNGDFYFGGFYTSKTTSGSYSNTDSDSFSRTFLLFRPEIGMTVHFE